MYGQYHCCKIKQLCIWLTRQWLHYIVRPLCLPLWSHISKRMGVTWVDMNKLYCTSNKEGTVYSYVCTAVIFQMMITRQLSTMPVVCAAAVWSWFATYNDIIMSTVALCMLAVFSGWPPQWCSACNTQSFPTQGCCLALFLYWGTHITNQGAKGSSEYPHIKFSSCVTVNTHSLH